MESNYFLYITIDDVSRNTTDLRSVIKHRVVKLSVIIVIISLLNDETMQTKIPIGNFASFRFVSRFRDAFKIGVPFICVWRQIACKKHILHKAILANEWGKNEKIDIRRQPNRI